MIIVPMRFVHSQRDRDVIHLQNITVPDLGAHTPWPGFSQNFIHRQRECDLVFFATVQNLDVDIREVGREQKCPCRCNADGPILRISRLAYNFYNSSRLLVWARD